MDKVDEQHTPEFLILPKMQISRAITVSLRPSLARNSPQQGRGWKPPKRRDEREAEEKSSESCTIVASLFALFLEALGPSGSLWLLLLLPYYVFDVFECLSLAVGQARPVTGRTHSNSDGLARPRHPQSGNTKQCFPPLPSPASPVTRSLFPFRPLLLCFPIPRHCRCMHLAHLRVG